MIAELQRKFIRISVLSILRVFTLIFLALAHFSTVQVKRTLDVLTRTVANAGSLEELAEQAGPAQGALYGGDSAFRLTTRTFLIWLDEEENLLRLDNCMPGVTESRAEELAREYRRLLSPGVILRHRRLGEGVLSRIENGYLYVRFHEEEKEKQFQYPQSVQNGYFTMIVPAKTEQADSSKGGASYDRN